MKNARRWADLVPMPGNFLNCSTSLWTGSAISMKRILEEAWDLQPAGQVSKLTLQRFIDLAAAFINGSDDEILQHILVAAAEHFRLDLDGEKVFLAIHLYGNHAAARGRFNNRCLHLFLQLLLHLLSLLHQLLQVHCCSPFAGLIWAISPRKTSKNLFTRGSSLAFPPGCSAFGCCSFIIRDTETGLPMRSLATASSTALCSLD